MFHMKQILKLLIFQLFFCFLCFSESYDYSKFLSTFKFKIFSDRKEVGFINIKISSTTSGYKSEVESYTDIPILFFIGGTYNSEIEIYDKNFTPISSEITTKQKNKQIFTSIVISSSETSEYICKFLKIKDKKEKHKYIKFKLPIITAGNVIPYVTINWDFEKENKIVYQVLDKDRFELINLKLSYLGKEGRFYKIKASLPNYFTTFLIYLDEDKNIKYAEGLGLKIYAE